MRITPDKIRSYRLRAHSLDKKLPQNALASAAGACGLQNTPPGAWETALYNRLEGCTLQALRHALYGTKELLQAWSFRGAPVIFPAAQSDIFLSPLAAQKGEEPWIYTQGIAGALNHLQMPFDDLLLRTQRAAAYLDSHTVKSKEALDRTLADIVWRDLPKEKQPLWCSPSIYGNPERQTMGAAAVSFLLRPCSFLSLVVFGQRQGISPTFTSYQNWLGRAPQPAAGADKALVRKFLHCYGPTTVEFFAGWLGCSPKQARRLWATLQSEMAPAEVKGQTRYMLQADMDDLLAAENEGERLVLLGAHDPYLDIRDRDIILEDRALHKTVWQYVANPGAVLRGGRVAGIWKTKTQKDRLDVTMTLWGAFSPAERQTLAQLAEEYAGFRQLRLASCTVNGG